MALQGAKLQQGRIPLYVRGDDANARQFPSLHAVQRHMADTGRFKMAWEDNEDEYEDFYNFDALPMEDTEAGVSGRIQSIHLVLPCTCWNLQGSGTPATLAACHQQLASVGLIIDEWGV